MNGFKRISQQIKDLVSLEHGLDKKATLQYIYQNNIIKGSDTWLLICSIVIASLGLDLNSPAVIIGAMLISPLMSPILGTGMAVGTNDWQTLSKSLKNFGLAIFISLITSTLYFSLTPFGIPTEEILARTEPTFLDILIAFFGGLAGIISVTRKEISNSIPGVAIATALMPPLCVVGFGLANATWIMALKAFYLFFLNSFFVAFATYLIIRFLRFPYKSYINSTEKRNGTIAVVAFMLILIIPSFYILSDVLDSAKKQNAISSFIEREIPIEKRKFIDSWQVYSTENAEDRLLIKLYGTPWDTATITKYQSILQYDYGVEKLGIELIPTSQFNLSHFKKLKIMLEDVKEGYSNQLEQIYQENNRYQRDIATLNQQIDSLSSVGYCIAQLKDEIKMVFDVVKEWQYIQNYTWSSEDNTKNAPSILIHTKTNIKSSEKDKIKSYFQMRCDVKNAIFIFAPDT